MDGQLLFFREKSTLDSVLGPRRLLDSDKYLSKVVLQDTGIVNKQTKRSLLLNKIKLESHFFLDSTFHKLFEWKSVNIF